MDLRPERFFRLDDYAHRVLFDDVSYVWESLGKIDAYLAANLRPGIDGTVSDGAIVEGDVYIGPGAVVEPGAWVQGPTIIGGGTVIRHGAYVRGGCIVGSNCVIGHATELKKVIMLDKCQAPHFNYVGDSILGSMVNLGAGTKISNFKNDGTEVVVRFGSSVIPTGMRKFGAVLGDRVHTGCNCVTSPGTLVGPDVDVYANAVLRGVYPPRSIVKLRQTHEVIAKSTAGAS